MLHYLAATKDFGIMFHQNPANCVNPWPYVDHNIKTHTYTDSNWGPQDASKPLPPHLETRTVTEEETQSIQGHVIMRQYGPVLWDLNRESRNSGSSCEAEIKTIDEGTKSTQYVRYIEDELSIGTPDIPTPLFNDNKGGVDWSESGKVTKKLRHCNIREWRIRQCRRDGIINIHFIPGKTNPSDLLTKEHKSPQEFCDMRDIILTRRPRDGGC